MPEGVKVEAVEGPVEAEAVVEAVEGEIVPEGVKVEAVEGPVEAEVEVEAVEGEIVPGDGATPEPVAADDKPDIEQVVDVPPVQSPSSEVIQETGQAAAAAPKAGEQDRAEPAEPQDAPPVPKAVEPGPPPEEGAGDKPNTGAGPDGDEDDSMDPDEDNLDKIKGDIMKALSKLERAEAD